MDSTIDLSIIVPIYKVEQFIERCAHSLFTQTYQNIEYIFVNDCTPDKSVEVLENVISQYPHLQIKIRIIHHDKNKGVAVARNTGLEAAQGEYVLQVDSDDWVEQTMIEELVLEAKKSNADIVWTDFYVDYPNSSKPSIYREQNIPESSNECINAILRGTMHGGSWNKIIKRELIISNTLRFPAGVNMCEDMVFVILCLLKTETIHYYPNAFYHYVQNENSITIATNRKTFESQFAAIKILEEKIPLELYEETLNLYKARLKNAVFLSGLFTNTEFRNCYPEANDQVVNCANGRLYKIALKFAMLNNFFFANLIILSSRVVFYLIENFKVLLNVKD